MKPEIYTILKTDAAAKLKGGWDGPLWRNVPCLTIDCFRPEGSDHRPRTFVKLLYNATSLFGIFRVEDQYVRCVHTGFQSDVWRDSCVELFLQPKDRRWYFNFEFNCGGALLASYVTNPARVDGRLQGFTPLKPEDDEKIRRFADLGPVVDPEIQTPLTWHLEFDLPWAVLKKYMGQTGELQGSAWRANFYKCGNDTSHPHWVSWMPLAARNFHEPGSFGTLIFGA